MSAEAPVNMLRHIPPSGGPVSAKLARVMAHVKRLKKSGHNKHFGYEFATDADVSDLVRGALAEEGVAFLPSMVGYERSGKSIVCEWAMRFVDGETGDTVEAQWFSEAMDSQDKGLNKAATAAVKYYLLKTFLISTGDEPDTDADGPVTATPKRSRPDNKHAEAGGGDGSSTPPSPPHSQPSAPPGARQPGQRDPGDFDDVNDVLRCIDSLKHPAHCHNWLKKHQAAMEKKFSEAEINEISTHLSDRVDELSYKEQAAKEAKTEDSNEFRSFLKKHRESESLSQKALADRIGISVPPLAKFLSGHSVNETTMEKIQAYVGQVGGVA